MKTLNSHEALLRKLERVQALYLRPGSEGEKQAAAIAIQKIQAKILSLQQYSAPQVKKYEFIIFKQV